MTTKSPLVSNFINFKLRFCVASILSMATTIATVTPSQAVQLQFSSPGNVSAIDGLVVDGTSYDITFKFDTFVNIFGLPDSPSFTSPTFWNNPQGAKRVVDSIALLLNSQEQIPSKINSVFNVFVPYRSTLSSSGSLFIINKIDDYIANWSNFRGESEDIFVLSNERTNYALFTPEKVQVPESNMIIGIVVVTFSFIGMRVKSKLSG